MTRCLADRSTDRSICRFLSRSPWWAIAAAAGSERHAETGRDLLRAQISVASWTYAIKLATDRTRPNGDPHSFPSGHASTSFATAMVLQDHFGWKVGLPAFVVASYTAASRVADNQHWTSDVVFGAALGIASARTVTIKFAGVPSVYCAGRCAQERRSHRFSREAPGLKRRRASRSS